MVGRASMELVLKGTFVTGMCNNARCAVVGGSKSSTPVVCTQVCPKPETATAWGRAFPKNYVHSSKQGRWRSVPARPGAHTRFAGGGPMGRGVGTTQLAPGSWGNFPKQYLSTDMIKGCRQLCEHTCACCIVSARIAVVVMLLSCHGAVHDFV